MTDLVRGLVAGVIGTSWMTAAQDLTAGGEPGDARSWEDAPAPAKVARKALRAVGVDPPPSWIPALTHVVHWTYGTGGGALYALARRRRGHSVASGAGFGLAVWAGSYATLVPLGVYEPPWRYDAKTLARDAGWHVVYGLGVSTAADALGPGR